MIVEVTQENISQGLVNSFRSSPVALAMQDKGLKSVMVSHWIIYDHQPTSLQLHNEVYLEIVVGPPYK